MTVIPPPRTGQKGVPSSQPPASPWPSTPLSWALLGCGGTGQSQVSDNPPWGPGQRPMQPQELALANCGQYHQWPAEGGTGHKLAAPVRQSCIFQVRLYGKIQLLGFHVSLISLQAGEALDAPQRQEAPCLLYPKPQSSRPFCILLARLAVALQTRASP